MRPRHAALALLAALAAARPARAAPLGSFAVDPAGVTVAGISSGGFMAVQLDVAYSSYFSGAAIFAGGPYDCAGGSAATAVGACATGYGLQVQPLVDDTNAEADAGAIDPPSNLAGKPIYLFSGQYDTVVQPAVMDALQQYYLAFTTAAEITYDSDTPAAHAWISPDGPNACGTLASPFVNACGIDPEGTFLGLFYGALAARNAGTLAGSLVQFDQTAFCPGGDCSGISLDDTGWLFVPASCSSGARCRLVVALHGCLQSQGAVGQAFVQEAGLNEWADGNDILVLYPQAKAGAAPYNPYGCWDFWGYSGADYALRSGPQMQAVMAMVDQIEAGSPTDGGIPAGPDAGTSTDGGRSTSSDAGTPADGGSPASSDADAGWRPIDGPRAAPAGGCGCASPPGPSASPALLAVLAAWFATRRRRLW
ncbi:MAG: extracellular catalytic domain type 2 short-chain-length polyhydroxyalkanoate depolymerase [Myxococcales bacterium]